LVLSWARRMEEEEKTGEGWLKKEPCRVME
jgi:hypothetical protein